jgi:hypothetical protein
MALGRTGSLKERKAYSSRRSAAIERSRAFQRTVEAGKNFQSRQRRLRFWLTATQSSLPRLAGSRPRFPCVETHGYAHTVAAATKEFEHFARKPA